MSGLWNRKAQMLHVYTIFSCFYFIHPSLFFSRLVLRSFTNSYSHPKNQDASLKPFWKIGASELLNNSSRCWSHTVWYSRSWRKVSSTSHHIVFANKMKTPKNAKTLFEGRELLFVDFHFLLWGLVTYPAWKVRDEYLFLPAAPVFLLLKSCVWNICQEGYINIWAWVKHTN